MPSMVGNDERTVSHNSHYRQKVLVISPPYESTKYSTTFAKVGVSFDIEMKGKILIYFALRAYKIISKRQDNVYA